MTAEGASTHQYIYIYIYIYIYYMELEVNCSEVRTDLYPKKLIGVGGGTGGYINLDDS